MLVLVLKSAINRELAHFPASRDCSLIKSALGDKKQEFERVALLDKAPSMRGHGQGYY